MTGEAQTDTRTHTRTNSLTHALTHSSMHARTHAGARTHTQTDRLLGLLYVNLLLFENKNMEDGCNGIFLQLISLAHNSQLL